MKIKNNTVIANDSYFLKNVNVDMDTSILQDNYPFKVNERVVYNGYINLEFDNNLFKVQWKRWRWQ